MDGLRTDGLYGWINPKRAVWCESWPILWVHELDQEIWHTVTPERRKIKTFEKMQLDAACTFD